MAQEHGVGGRGAALRSRRVAPPQSRGSQSPGSAPAPPPFPDVPASELHELLSRKLAQCGVMFDFLDCVADLKGKEVKRAALNELVECVGSTRGVLIEPVYPDIIRMVSTCCLACGGGGGWGRRTLLTCGVGGSVRENPGPSGWA